MLAVNCRLCRVRYSLPSGAGGARCWAVAIQTVKAAGTLLVRLLRATSLRLERASARTVAEVQLPTLRKHCVFTLIIEISKAVASRDGSHATTLRCRRNFIRPGGDVGERRGSRSRSPLDPRHGVIRLWFERFIWEGSFVVV